MRIRWPGVAALALGVGCLTVPAYAQDAPQAPVAAATPLTLRPTHPLTLAPASSGSGAWKLGLFAVVGAGLFWFARRRGIIAAPRRESWEIEQRIPLGARSEVVILHIDGQRLALGVTPYSIQTLASLEPREELETSVSPTAEEPPVRERISASLDALGDNARVTAVFDELRAPKPHREKTRTGTRRRELTPANEVEEQARGLLALRGIP